MGHPEFRLVRAKAREARTLQIRENALLLVKTLAGIVSMYVTMCGVNAAFAMDFRADTLLVLLYCVIPAASIFIFALVKRAWPEIGLHLLLALLYLMVHTALDWRTCAELGYCGSVAATVMETARTRPIEAAFAVVVLSIGALMLGGGRMKEPTHG